MSDGDKVTLDIDGSIATITNRNVDKHNAFDDEMDAQLFGIFDELAATPSVRAIVWRGEGKSWSSGRDVSAIGNNVTEMIAEVVAARKLETTGHEIIKTVHPHPTMSEAIMEAAAAAYDEVIHL